MTILVFEYAFAEALNEVRMPKSGEQMWCLIIFYLPYHKMDLLFAIDSVERAGLNKLFARRQRAMSCQITCK